MMTKAEWKEGWKIIRRKGRMSCTWDRLRPVRYKKDIVVGRPKKCGPLAVFQSKEAAEDFLMRFLCDRHEVFVIVPCIYLPSKHRRLWETHTKIPQYKNTMTNYETPFGTRYAEKVKCLE